RLGGRATEGISRQPEATARIQTAMIIAAALVEGVALFVAGIAFLIQGKITFYDGAWVGGGRARLEYRPPTDRSQATGDPHAERCDARRSGGARLRPADGR